jgi:hypothetical protein
MEQINLSEFLSLFGYTSVDDCWLNADCIIDESGIKTRHIAKHSDEDYIDRTNYSQRVELSFPCTAQQIFLWAQCLDKWERFSAVGSQNHVVEKLPKVIVDKWQPVNEWYMDWCYARGDIKEKIGTSPFNVKWNRWLSLPKWTKKEAALLISGLEPDKFHLIERDADFQSMCEPLVELLRKIPDDLTQRPFDWLNWFDGIGNLIYAEKPLLVWFNQQSDIVALQAVVDGGAGSHEVTEPVGIEDKISNPKRTATYKTLYTALCVKHEDNIELIKNEINQLTNDEEIIECWNLASKDEKHLWASADRISNSPAPTTAAQGWFNRNAHKIRGFKKEPGK